ncbi:MAG: cob(I)yrinic acid a,c-diamide adenosyltransferase [Melioribacteraceae bacterium]|nr:cob(I)yrinic acid a,c-diamide adenosyltransferase [Melioribacteraceae bacterium]
MKIYTKTGDKGETSLFGGKRVWKDDQRIKAYGTIDELNAQLGLTITEIKSEELIDILKSIQNELFTICSDLATPFEVEIKNFNVPRINETYINKIEKLIDEFDAKIPTLKNFILPGGTKGASNLHLARTICRRAEREIVTLSKIEKINPTIEIYINRLSDLLFVFARYENHFQNVSDVVWQKE